MKVICDRGALLSAINLVSGVAAQRTPRPQLQCVKLTARKTGKVGDLTLAATDAEVSLKLKLTQVDVQQPGEALIPADPLRQIISAEEHEPTLTIEAEQDACHIKGGDAHFKIFGYPPAEFPPIPDFDKVASGAGGAGEGKARAALTQPAGALQSMITRTLFATARENSRYAINGVLLKREGKKLEMVATDGRRLAMVRQNITGGEKDAPPISCIIPTKALSMLQKLIDDPDDTVQIAITDSQVLFSIGGKEGAGRAVLVSNLVEGAFLPYEDVIPRDQDKKIVFDRDVLMSAVRVRRLTNEESRGVRMRFNAADKQVELSSRAPEKGESEIKAEIASYEGDNLEIGFNPQFLADALKVIPETEVILELKDAKKPGMMKSGADFLYVVMPVNLQ